MPRRPHSEILPFDEKRFRLELKDMRRRYSHLDEYLPYLQHEVDTVRTIKEAGEDPRGHRAVPGVALSYARGAFPGRPSAMRRSAWPMLFGLMPTARPIRLYV